MASIPKPFQKWAAHDFLKHSILELKGLYSPCAQTTPSGDKTGEDTGLPQEVTVSLWRQGLSTGSIRELSKVHHLEEQEWEVGQAVSCSLSLHSLHPKEELS